MSFSPKHLIKFREDIDFILKTLQSIPINYTTILLQKTVLVSVHNGKNLKKGTFLALRR